MSKDKEIDKLMALISQPFKKIYKPTNNNLRTSSNTSRTNQDNSPRSNRSTGYENQRIGYVVRARETVGSTLAWKSRIQCYNYKEFRHVTRECQKPKRVKEAAYHREKMLLCSYNDNLVLMLAPESDEVIHLEKESRSKLSDLIRPFDYNKLNNLYDLFVPQREKSSEQRYFLERSRLSHTSVNNGNSKESFNKQTTLLEKRMDESIPWDQKCKSSIGIFKVKTQFLNEIDRLSREYYYANHMNTFLDVYTELDEVTNLQCDYLELLEKYECLEIELSKSKMMSKSFEELQKHAINLEIDLQQYKWKPKSGKQNVNPNLVEIVLFIIDYGCSKHMTGNLKLLINFVEKFLGTVKFRNDQIAHILGYGDLTLHAYFAVEGILHQTSVAQTPEQNSIVERQNRTLVEAAQTMLSAAKVPLCFWAEAIATTCFTQNRSLVIPRHEKTPYHIIND
nr:putative ribonuclease H-like domain-containing protein [Tanacetum cinerariifolium]